MNSDKLTATENFVKTIYATRESGHDMLHIRRVMNNAITIAADFPTADLFIIKMAVLLHDVGDSKFFNHDENEGRLITRNFVASLQLSQDLEQTILDIIENMSFKHSFGQKKEKSIEFQIVQDADRLDAIGAIGIARTFNYGGHQGMPLYDDNIKPQVFHDSQSYKTAQSTTLNHFYEKLLLLKDLMNTATAKTMAEKRHQFMLEFLQQFNEERDGKR